MSQFYKRVLKPTLAKRIGEALDQTELVQQLNVSEELALIREATSHRVELYAALLEEAQKPDTKITHEQLMAAAEIMRAGLEDVVKVAKINAEIERMKLDIVSGFTNAMTAVITTVCQAAYKVFENDHRVKDFELLLRTELRTKAAPGTEGTTITPDMDVMSMDACIPAAPITERPLGSASEHNASLASGVAELLDSSSTSTSTTATLPVAPEHPIGSGSVVEPDADADYDDSDADFD